MPRTLLIDPSSLVPATLTPPPSKSDAQRALVLAHLLGASELRANAAPHGLSLPDDVRVVARGLEVIAAGSGDIDCGDGGAPFRLLLTQACLKPGADVRFTGSARLGERPHGDLMDALERALGPTGVTLERGSPWPVRVRVPAAPALAREPQFRVRARESSQFASSLLLGACGLFLREQRPWTVALEDVGGSMGYLGLTVRWAERCGFTIASTDDSFTVSAHHAPATWPSVPGDWSSLGYLLLLAWASGGEATGVDAHADHPDRAVLRVLTDVGLQVEESAQGRWRVTGTAQRGLRATARECPDLLPTLAALACVCPEPSVLEDVHLLRAKESDRLEGIQSLVAAVGGSTALDAATNRLTLHPPAQPRPFRFHSRGDHRMAMSASLLAVLARVQLDLEEPECVSKSFPDFFGQLARAGVRVSS